MKEQSATVEDTILSRIGNLVAFRYPGDEGVKTGKLRDRAVLRSTDLSATVPYWDVIDLIEFEKQTEPWMRIGYYRKKEKLNWGSQTTITEPISVWKRLLVTAAREKEWFRDLLCEVMDEVRPDEGAGDKRRRVAGRAALGATSL